MKQLTIAVLIVLAAGNLVAQTANTNPGLQEPATDSVATLQHSTNEAGSLVSSPLPGTWSTGMDLETIAYHTNNNWSFAPSTYSQVKYPVSDKTSLYFRRLNQDNYRIHFLQQKDSWVRELAGAVLSNALYLIADAKDYFYYSPY